jgi:hypothetical protein
MDPSSGKSETQRLYCTLRENKELTRQITKLDNGRYYDQTNNGIIIMHDHKLAPSPTSQAGKPTTGNRVCVKAAEVVRGIIVFRWQCWTRNSQLSANGNALLFEKGNIVT